MKRGALVLPLSLLLVSALAPAPVVASVVPAGVPATVHGAQPLVTVFAPAAKAIPRLELAAMDPVHPKLEFMPRVGESRAPSVAALPAPARSFTWSRQGDRWISDLVVESPGAMALRVGVQLEGPPPQGLEVLAGRPGDAEAMRFPVEAFRAVPDAGSLLWTPVTSGDAQRVQLAWSGAGPPPSVHVADVSHLSADPHRPETASRPKVLSCHQNWSCATQSAVQQAGRAVARLVITSGGQSFFCSGALLTDRAQSGTPWFGTSDHCGITTGAVAANVQFFWSYELSCGSNAPVQGSTTIGSALQVTDARVDYTLLRITGPMPGGLVMLGWNAAALSSGSSVFGVHHPAGFYKSTSSGAKVGEETVSFRGGSNTWTIAADIIDWAAGVTEGGSSGSPLLSADGSYRGALSAGPANATCTNANLALYTRFSNVYPKIRQFIDPVAATTDDWPDSAAGAAPQPGFTTTTQNGRLNSGADQDWFKLVIPQQGTILINTSDGEGPRVDTIGRIYGSNGTTVLLENDDAEFGDFGVHFAMFARIAPGTYYVQVTGFQGATGNYIFNTLYAPDDDHNDFISLGTQLPVGGTLQGQISRAGDADFFIVDVATAGTLNLASSGSTDVVGFLYDSTGRFLASNDDVSASNLNFAISRQVAAGRHYLRVLGYDVTTRGAYTVSAQMQGGGGVANLTGLWWNASESGWGINFNHQSDIVFATLFTYRADGSPMWLVASDLLRQSDGSFSGALYRVQGPAYFLNTWGAVTVTQVGTMRVQAGTGGSNSLTYSVDGVNVAKTITRQVFANPVPNCSFGGSRAASTNYQDLWWNPAEPGWGINFTHQGTLLFATLFVYGSGSQDRWFVASDMARQPDGSFTGELYATTGPVYNANPWGSVSVRDVGSITARFTNGESGTLTYTIDGTTITRPITRQVFGASPSNCQ